MRISVDKKDKGYTEFAVCCKVFLNGDAIKHCITADEDLGYVYCYLVENGRGVIEGDEFKRKVSIGTVRIDIPEEYRKFFERREEA